MMVEKSSRNPYGSRTHTQWEGLFVSEHAWDYGEAAVDPQPMLSAEEKRAINDLLLVACGRKCTVFIHSWNGRHFHFHRCTALQMDWEERIVTCEDVFGKKKIEIDAITSIHMPDC